MKQIATVEFHHLLQKNILDLKNNVEDFSQLDNSSYSSYLDFDDISKLPEMLLLNMLKKTTRIL